MHFAPTYNTHAAFSFTKDTENFVHGSSASAIIPGTDFMLCVDSTYPTVYLLQRRGMGTEDIFEILENDIPDDLVICRHYLSMSNMLSEAVCGGICTDTSGSNIYLLMLQPPYGCIKHLVLNNLQFEEQPTTYFLPSSPTTLYPDFYDLPPEEEEEEEEEEIGDPSLPDLPVKPVLPPIFGTGRVDTIDLADSIGEICFINKYIFGSGITYNKGRLFVLTRRKINLSIPLEHPFTHTLERCTSLYFSLLMEIDPINGYCTHLCRITTPSLGGAIHAEDVVLHGLASYRDQLILGKRNDKTILTSYSELWGIQQLEQYRGEGSLVSLDIAQVETTPAPGVSYAGHEMQLEYKDYPFEIALASSLTIDEGACKLFALFGDRSWTFDILHYTLLVLYGDVLFEGDIIDFGSVKDAGIRILQCFLRNDDIQPMYNTTANVYLKKDESRREDVFLASDAVSTGVRHLTLGTILPGESVAFEVRVYALGITSADENTTIRLPLRIKYDLV